MEKGLPTFSIIVPTYNRLDQLTLCLRALSNLEYANDDFEVIVVDDGSSISPEPVVASFSNRINITLIRQENSGPATARNIGATHAKGRYLAFTDDDCIPASDWLQALKEQFTATQDHIIGGKTLNKLQKNLFSIASYQLILYLYDYYNSDSNKGRFFTSNNIAVSAEGFRAIGGFNTTFPLAAGEDRELCDRWLYHGYKMTYLPEAIVYHNHAMFLRGFWRQHFNYGRGAFYFHQIRLNRHQDPIRFEPLSFYMNLLRYPFTQSRDMRAILLMLLLLCSQVAGTTGYFWEKNSRWGIRLFLGKYWKRK